MLCSFQYYSESSPSFLPNIFPIPHLWRSFPIIQSPLIYFHRPLVFHPTSDLCIYPVKQIFIVFYGQQQLKVLFRGLLHINAARKAAVVHLMRWWQLFSQIFLCSYPFPVHLKSIFNNRSSSKVVQGKTKVTLQIFVRSKEDDPLEPTLLDTYLLNYLLRGLSSCFLLLECIIIKEWDFKPNTKAQVLAPIIIHQIFSTLQYILSYEN